MMNKLEDKVKRSVWTRVAFVAHIAFGLELCTAAQVNRSPSSNSVAIGKAFGPSTPAIDLVSSEKERTNPSVKGVLAERAVSYNAKDFPPIYDSHTGKVLLHTEYINEFSQNALPVSSADLIVVARISLAAAHLSADGSRIFSSFSLDPSLYLKGKGSKGNATTSLQADRLGGVALLPDGSRHFMGVSDRGIPESNRTYLLFLQRTATFGTYQILTGYLLDEGRVSSLDRAGDSYDRIDANALLQKVKRQIRSKGLRQLVDQRRKLHDRFRN